MPTKKLSSGIESSPAEWTDPDDAPKLTREWFQGADYKVAGRTVRRGRPKLDNPKQPIKLRLSPEVLAHFRASGAGWQTRINDALLKMVKRAKRPRVQTKRAEAESSGSGEARTPSQPRARSRLSPFK